MARAHIVAKAPTFHPSSIRALPLGYPSAPVWALRGSWFIAARALYTPSSVPNPGNPKYLKSLPTQFPCQIKNRAKPVRITGKTGKYLKIVRNHTITLTKCKKQETREDHGKKPNGTDDARGLFPGRVIIMAKTMFTHKPVCAVLQAVYHNSALPSVAEAIQSPHPSVITPSHRQTQCLLLRLSIPGKARRAM